MSAVGPDLATVLGAGGQGQPPLETMLAAARAGVPHTIAVRPRPTFQAALSQAILDLHALVALADDPQDKQTVIQCLGALQKIEATDQAERDQAMGGKFSPRQMRKSRGGY